jgi:hypothetical protein
MKRISALVGVLFVLMAPSAALAQSSTCQQYQSQICSEVTTTTGSTPDATSNTAGTLPFTGLDIVLLLVGGGALLSAGFVVRRVSRRLN